MTQENIRKLQNNIGKVLIGKEETVELVMIAMISNGHILMEDVPGTGKTLLAKSLAKSINGTFRRVQMTPDVLPSDVTGIQFYNPKTQSFETKVGPVMTNILLTDEINRATPRTQSSLLEVMEEHQVTIEGDTLSIPAPFIVIATQNPIESQGTFQLPEAQMDRFFIQIKSGYPTLAEEKQMMHIYRTHQPLNDITPVFSLDDILTMYEDVKKVQINDDVENYMLSIVQATREAENIETGVSPRGTLAFMRGAQARAYLHDRTYVTPEDVKQLAVPILSHRLVLSIEGQMRMTKQQIMKDILNTIDVPIESGAM